MNILIFIPINTNMFIPILMFIMMDKHMNMFIIIFIPINMNTPILILMTIPGAKVTTMSILMIMALMTTNIMENMGLTTIHIKKVLGI
jgi:hypothetical protein